MTRKRIIFVLLVNGNSFALSRNFRLQQVGDLRWLKENYRFDLLSSAIDELIILDVTRGKRSPETFAITVKEIVKDCFVPTAVGGGIRDVRTAIELLRNGADKIILNSALFSDPQMVNELARQIGAQSIVASVDLSNSQEGATFRAVVENGSQAREESAYESLSQVAKLPVGEILLTSIERDGTGMGLDVQLLSYLPTNVSQPIILCGGVGTSSHIHQGLSRPEVSGVATANLLNFVGDGLSRARSELTKLGVDLAVFHESMK